MAGLNRRNILIFRGLKIPREKLREIFPVRNAALNSPVKPDVQRRHRVKDAVYGRTLTEYFVC